MGDDFVEVNMREMRLTMFGLVGLPAAATVVAALALALVEAGVEEVVEEAVVAPVPAADVGGTGSDSPFTADRFMPATARVN